MSKASVLPTEMKLVGDVSGEDDFVVYGSVEGEVHIDGVLVVERSGSVRGNVSARTVAIRGVVVGDASATETIRVDEGGSMVGDVRAPRVNIVKGAKFRGHVHMTGRGTDDARAVQGSSVQATLAPSQRPTLRRRRTRSEVQAPSDDAASPDLQPTAPGSVRAVHSARTIAGAELGELGRKPPSPRIPALRRTRATRRTPDDAL